MNDNFKILTGRVKENLVEYNGHLIEKFTCKNFLKLKDAALKEIGADLQIVSGYRSYVKQEKIWNLKAKGERKVFDDMNQVVDVNELNPREICLKILRFSALPGLSRHHWGTELDLFDQNQLDKEDVKLQPWEWEPNGPFYNLNLWLEDKISNDQSFGFFRPYSSDLGGIHPEAWHLSYKPISEKRYQDYTKTIFIKNLKNSNFLYKEIIQKNLDEIFDKFFCKINP